MLAGLVSDRPGYLDLSFASAAYRRLYPCVFLVRLHRTLPATCLLLFLLVHLCSFFFTLSTHEEHFTLGKGLPYTPNALVYVRAFRDINIFLN